MNYSWLADVLPTATFFQITFQTDHVASHFVFYVLRRRRGSKNYILAIQIITPRKVLATETRACVQLDFKHTRPARTRALQLTFFASD